MVDFAGFAALPITYCKYLIAASTTFQSWTSQGTYTLAKTRVYELAISTPASADYPYAAVGPRQDEPFRIEKIAEPAGFEAAGTLAVLFCDDYASGDETDAAKTFYNAVVGIVKDMAVNSGKNSDSDLFLDFVSANCVDWGLSHPDSHTKEARRFMARFDVPWANAKVY
ncbi:MAG: hypothetical protein JSU68_01440 [Phycisphaerales bacterium]|nr:MAG: hypothetical protein JSU68_01440 [Phycisphaerales bacterium]